MLRKVRDSCWCRLFIEAANNKKSSLVELHLSFGFTTKVWISLKSEKTKQMVVKGCLDTSSFLLCHHAKVAKVAICPLNSPKKVFTLVLYNPSPPAMF